MLIGITGTISSGKDVVAKFFTKKGFDYFSHSDEIKEILANEGVEASRQNLRNKGNEVRKKFGPAYLSKRILKKVKGDSVILSIRNLFELAEYRQRSDFYFIAVDAPVRRRFSWAKKRGKLGDAKTLFEFIAIENRENSKVSYNQNLADCIKKADYQINNEGTIKDLYAKAEKIYQQIKAKSKS